MFSGENRVGSSGFKWGVLCCQVGVLGWLCHWQSQVWQKSSWAKCYMPKTQAGGGLDIIYTTTGKNDRITLKIISLWKYSPFFTNQFCLITEQTILALWNMPQTNKNPWKKDFFSSSSRLWNHHLFIFLKQILVQQYL